MYIIPYTRERVEDILKKYEFCEFSERNILALWAEIKFLVKDEPFDLTLVSGVGLRAYLSQERVQYEYFGANKYTVFTKTLVGR